MSADRMLAHTILIGELQLAAMGHCCRNCQKAMPFPLGVERFDLAEYSREQGWEQRVLKGEASWLCPICLFQFPENDTQ